MGLFKHKFYVSACAALLTAAFFMFELTPAAWAAVPGTLDPQFGTLGRLVRNVAGNDEAAAVVVQPDGKIIVAGTDNVTGASDFIVVRLTAGGSLDQTFDGVVAVDFGGTDEARDVVLQSDGRIVVVGQTKPAGGLLNTAIARIMPGGSMDSTFGVGGKVIIDAAPGNSDSAQAVALQADGRIVTAGFNANDFVLTRTNTDGSPDTTFSGDGIATTNFGSTDVGRDVVIQPDGKIVAVGQGGTNGDFLLARYNANGAPDTTFDTDGLVATEMNGFFDSARSVALQPDGKIVVGGNVGFNTASDSALARYNSDGSLDTTFDTDGKVFVPVLPSGLDSIQSVIVESGGRIVAAGSAANDFDALRLNPNGSLDQSFGTGGIVVTETAASETGQAAVVYGSELLVAGRAAGVGDSDVGVNRYHLLVSPTMTGDFDGDGYTDSTVYRPSNGTWFTLKSFDNTVTIEQFGLNGDVPMDGDYDGDGKSDLCIFRPSSGVWFFKRSSNGTTLGAQFGQASDKPQSGDYDKDGKSDIAVWRPSNGNYFVLRSSSNFSNFFSYPFGAPGDIPVQGGAQ